MIPLRDFRILLVALLFGLGQFSLGQVAGPRLVLNMGHVRYVQSVLSVRNGQTLVTSGDDGRVIMWDVKSQRVVASLDAGSDGVLDLRWNDKTSTLDVATGAKVIRWNPVSSQSTTVLNQGGCVLLGEGSFAYKGSRTTVKVKSGERTSAFSTRVSDFELYRDQSSGNNFVIENESGKRAIGRWSKGALAVIELGSAVSPESQVSVANDGSFATLNGKVVNCFGASGKRLWGRALEVEPSSFQSLGAGSVVVGSSTGLLSPLSKVELLTSSSGQQTLIQLDAFGQPSFLWYDPGSAKLLAGTNFDLALIADTQSHRVLSVFERGAVVANDDLTNPAVDVSGDGKRLLLKLGNAVSDGEVVNALEDTGLLSRGRLDILLDLESGRDVAYKQIKNSRGSQYFLLHSVNAILECPSGKDPVFIDPATRVPYATLHLDAPWNRFVELRQQKALAVWDQTGILSIVDLITGQVKSRVNIGQPVELPSLYSPSEVEGVRDFALSPDGKTLVTFEDWKTIVVRDPVSGLKTGAGYPKEDMSDKPFFFGSPGIVFAFDVDHGVLRGFELATGKEVAALTKKFGTVYDVQQVGGQNHAMIRCERGLEVWNLSTMDCVLSINEPYIGTASIAASDDFKTWYFYSGRGVLSVCHLVDNRKFVDLATMVASQNGNWIVVAPGGQFDSNELVDQKLLSWVLPSDPWRPLPVEAYLRDFYEPRLLGRILAHESLPTKPLPRVTEDLPQVTVTSVEITGRIANVTIHADNAHALSNLKLFCNGILVRQFGPGETGTEMVARGIKLPPGKSCVWTAYGFNPSGIKGETSVGHVSPGFERGAVRPALYTVAIGCNYPKRPELRLNFAAADARLCADSLRQGLNLEPTYDMVLVSDEGHEEATKDSVRKAFERLKEANPEDIVYIHLSGHGTTAPSGQFMFLPSDVAVDKLGTEQIASSAISDDELAEWLAPVQSSHLFVVLDCCRAASSIQGAAEKLGPFSSRGFGQLAYDKKATILVATSTTGAAMEGPQFGGHGKLTYSLYDNGLRKGLAFYEGEQSCSVRQLFDFSIFHLTHESLNSNGALEKGVKSSGQIGAVKDKTQTPVMFDFSRNSETPMLRLIKSVITGQVGLHRL